MSLNTNDATMVLVAVAIILLLLALLIGCCRFVLWFLFGWPRKMEPTPPLFTSQSSVTYTDPSDNLGETQLRAEPVQAAPERVVESDSGPGPTYITNNYEAPRQVDEPPPRQPRAYEPPGSGEGYEQQPLYQPAPVYGSPDNSDPVHPAYTPPARQQPAPQPTDYREPELRREMPDGEYDVPSQPAPVQQVYYQPTYHQPQQTVYYQPTNTQSYYQPPATPAQPKPAPPDYGYYEPPVQQPIEPPDFSAIPPYEQPPMEGLYAPIEQYQPDYYYQSQQPAYQPQPYMLPPMEGQRAPDEYDPWGEYQLAQSEPMPIVPITPMFDESSFLPVLGSEFDVPVAEYPSMDAPFSMQPEQE